MSDAIKQPLTTEFVHLRVHTEYSLVDGIVRIAPLLEQVKKGQMPAVAITDVTNLFATVKFYRKSLASGIKPILGADLWIRSDDQENISTSLITLLVVNHAGYLNLIDLISRSYTEGQHLGKPSIKREWLGGRTDGLICLSGAMEGDVGISLVSENRELASEQLKEWMTQFPDRFYLELQRLGLNDEEHYIERAVNLASELNCPVVATNNVRFLSSEEYEAHEVRVCINQGRVIADPTRPRSYTEGQYLKTPAEMAELFSDLPEALQNSVEIARRCNLSVELDHYSLPEYPIPQGMTEAEFFRQESHQGLERRLEKLLDLDDPELENKRQVYIDRLNVELDIILQMGFPGYFLIVMDFIRWAKQNSIPVGPGRGSGAGSLVAYALDITDLDPLAYDLLFERFLNPERVSMPDFDVDFCMENRDHVIAYVSETYGRNAVSQIVTFGTMAAKAVVRDVARVQGKSYGLADKLSKMIPFEVGMTLEKAYEQEEPLREFLKHDEDAEEIWSMALQLEGITRNCGKHAGGVVIAPTKLTDFAPLYCDDEGASLVTQYDKDDVESVGLVKFDFLGLRTLTIIDWAVKNMNRTRARLNQDPITIEELPLVDEPTFELLKSGNTTAVFQLESRGMKDLIKKLQPSSFEDIVALVALFRPGPLQSGMVDDFIDRKHGRAQVSYPHPDYQHEDLKPILEPTYGIILYQEQVMQIAQVLGGYTLGSADLLRRAMGKKKPEEMAKQRQIFLEGAANRDVDADLAGNIFDLMEKFAGYGFNKSHSAAYALIAYQTAWLKSHYPAEFMAAVMSADLQNTDKVVTFIDEARSMGLEIVPPSVNDGYFGFTVNLEGEIVYGLGALKGLGEGPVESIITARESEGAFSDLFDFCNRVDLKKVNKRALEAIIKAGALDKLTPFSDNPSASRSLLLEALPSAVQTAEQASSNQEAGIEDLFGDFSADTSPNKQVDPYTDYISRVKEELSMGQRLKGEKETLGLFLTGHPVDEYREELKDLSGNRLVDLEPSKSVRVISGLILNIRTMKNKRGDTMAVMTLDDASARVDVTLFPDVFNSSRDILLKDSIVIVEGKAEHDDFNNSVRVRADKVVSLQTARNQRLRELCVRIVDSGETQLNGASEATEQKLFESASQLKQLLAPYQGGNCPVRVNFRQNGFAADFVLGNEWRVEARDDLLLQLRRNFGNDRLELRYS